MEPSDVEASEYILGTNHVRLIRVGKLIQLLFSNGQDAKIYYAEAASKLKSAEDKFRREFPCGLQSSSIFRPP